jgi:Ser/Thr protein kinase RdoA (MazF antagonist)
MTPKTGNSRDRRVLSAVHAIQHRRLVNWWIDDPLNPGRADLSHPAVRQLITEIAPGSRISDLGGTMSLNVRIEPKELVLRVQQPFVSRQRLRALQAIRINLACQGLIVPVPLGHHGSTIFRCGDRWAELEPYIPQERLAPTPASYSWLFGAIGRLHRALATLDLKVPRPLIATYAPPASLQRWLRVAESAVQDDAEAGDIILWTRDLLNRLRRQWVPASRLPMHLVHGDVRLSNMRRSPDGNTVYLDFGFLAVRPRIHDLAYSIAFMLLALNSHTDPTHAWQRVPYLLEAYETTAAVPLTALERDALAVYTAAVPLYFAALAGFNNDPVRQLRANLPFLYLSEWLLAHPHAYRPGYTLRTR